jgi:hypothetical protein
LLVAALLVLFLPFYQHKHASPRPLYATLSGLQPYRTLLGAPNNKLLVGDYAGELANYLQYGTDETTALPLSFRTYSYAVLNDWDKQQPLELFLRQGGFTAFLIQPRIMPWLRAVPAARAFVEGRTEYRPLNSLVDRDWTLYALAPPQ